MMHIYHLWLKEYTDVYWTEFIILFIISSLPMFIRKMQYSILFLQVYNLWVNLIIPSFLQPCTNPPLGHGNDNFITAFFLSFGIGYALLYFRKERKTKTDGVVSIISLILFSGIIFLVIVKNIKYF